MLVEESECLRHLCAHYADEEPLYLADTCVLDGVERSKILGVSSLYFARHVVPFRHAY